MAKNAIYSTSVMIDRFSGLNQMGDGHNMSMRYACEMENVNVSGGSFQPMREGLMMEQTLTTPIGTLAYLHRRFGGENVAGTTLMIAISSGKVYSRQMDSSDEWTELYDGVSDNDCDWVTYEVNTYAEYNSQKKYAVGDRVTHENTQYKCSTAITVFEEWNAAHWTEITGTDPVDVLLFTNATDGMFCVYSDDMSVVKAETPKKFGVLARYNERIWGSGIEGDPDVLMYSAPYDPFNWEQDFDIPEDGAGEIMQPTWDGDSFVALRQYGSDLLAVKRNSIWRVYGTNPGEFVMQRQYGGGTIEENTLSVHDDIAYMLGENGLMRYDGTGVYAFLQEELKKLMHDKVNHEKLSKACSGMRSGIYCLALPINGSNYCNAILEYNPKEQTFALRTEISVDSFMQIDERLFYTSNTYPGHVFELRDDLGVPLPCVWVSGYQDLGMKNAIKSAFVAYMMVESEAPVELRVGIRTEKKLKQKTFQTKPGKMTRLHLNLQGRIFRLEIRSYSAVPFTIAGGVRLDLELDPD